MSETRIIAVLNQKGGVGKTTIATNLAHGLARKGKKVLAIDLDPQGHMTASLGMAQRKLPGVDDCLLKDKSLLEVSYDVRENLKLVPAGPGLSEFEKLSEGGAARGMLLKNKLATEIDDYDFVIMDCPPSSNLLVSNAIFASNEVMIPMTGDYLGLQGLAFLMRTLKKFEQAMGHSLIQWIVLSRYHARRRISQEVKISLMTRFTGRVLQTEISESVHLAECPGFGKTIFEYKPNSKSALEYDALVDELLTGRNFDGNHT
ncbi:MAG: ParA family protein [Gammaproteobacteria bacterium]|nr:ParA family protein [Gammaproteobacteria bacterium]